MIFPLNIRLANAFPLSLSFLVILFMVIVLAFILLNIFILFFVHLLLLALSVIFKNIRITVLEDDKDPLKLVLNRKQFKCIVLVHMILS